MKLKVKKLHTNAIIPKYQTAGAACFDIHALIEDGSSFVRYAEPATIRTGLSFEVPEGHVMLVFSRSGHGFKSDTRLANCVGVLDSDYRGELFVKLTRDPRDLIVSPIEVLHGDRIAQAMIFPIPSVELEEATELSDTERGTNGLGSTGV